LSGRHRSDMVEANGTRRKVKDGHEVLEARGSMELSEIQASWSWKLGMRLKRKLEKKNGKTATAREGL